MAHLIKRRIINGDHLSGVDKYKTWENAFSVNSVYNVHPIWSVICIAASRLSFDKTKTLTFYGILCGYLIKRLLNSACLIYHDFNQPFRI